MSKSGEVRRRSELESRLILEAQGHAGEARAANHTIAEIYQIVTGKTGEPGNWNGAEPVRAAFVRLAVLEDALEACDVFLRDLTDPDKQASGPNIIATYSNALALRSKVRSTLSKASQP